MNGTRLTATNYLCQTLLQWLMRVTPSLGFKGMTVDITSNNNLGYLRLDLRIQMYSIIGEGYDGYI